ncbi:MAG TPA: ABC transporter permease [Gemmataceae bacterium]|nr:ABC transporter permease [Gemmataceae bacterium]
MVGAVLQQEWLLGSRRSRLHVFRWIYAGWLILLVLYGFVRYVNDEYQRLHSRGVANTSTFIVRSSAPEVVGQWFTETFVSQQMLLLVLATPALVAGAITDEKRRGTLQYLLTADLESRHIVLGKLLGRVAQVVLVALAGLPLFALLAGFGGVEPITLLALGVALIVPLFALASLTLLASVWCRQTRDAVLALYIAGTLAGLAVWYFQGFLRYFNPLFVLAPTWGAWRGMDLPELGHRLLLSSLCWGTLGGVCLGLAIWRLRPAYVAELENERPRFARWYSFLRAPVQEEPIHWRERHVEGLAPTPELRRIPQWLGVTAIVVLSTLSSSLILLLSLPAGVSVGDVIVALAQFQPGKLAVVLPSAGNGFLVQGLLVMLLASLVVGIRCSGAVTGERERQTWEALLLTPLSAKQLIRGKLWGIMGASYVYLLAYAGPALVLSVLGGVMALLWVVLWLAVTVLAMYYIGAAGLWASVRSKNSWRALLITMLAGYIGGLAVYAPTSIILMIVSFIIGLMLAAIDKQFGTQLSAAAGSFSLDHRVFSVLTCLGLALIFWLMSRLFLSMAMRWVADRERTRHWYEEPIYRRSRRRPAKMTR